VSHLGPHTHLAQSEQVEPGRDELLACDYFRMDRLQVQDSRSIAGGLGHYLLMICLKGAGTINGKLFSAGEAWMVPAGAPGFPIDSGSSEWMVAYSATERAAY
jgi:mannose-6-phosphate isomerase class I